MNMNSCTKETAAQVNTLTLYLFLIFYPSWHYPPPFLPIHLPHCYHHRVSDCRPNVVLTSVLARDRVERFLRAADGHPFRLGGASDHVLFFRGEGLGGRAGELPVRRPAGYLRGDGGFGAADP